MEFNLPEASTHYMCIYVAIASLACAVRQVYVAALVGYITPDYQTPTSHTTFLPQTLSTRLSTDWYSVTNTHTSSASQS